MFPVRLPSHSSFTRVVGQGKKSVSKRRGGGASGGNGGEGGDGSNPPPSGNSPKRRKRRLRAGGWLLLTLWSAAAVGVISYAARKDIAREVAQNWLKAQGIPAELRIDSLSLENVSGRAVLGAAGKPDLVIERFDVDYDLNFFNFGQPLTRLRSVHLVKPDLTFAYDKSGFGFGTLDKLLKGSAGPGGAPPENILVEDARIRVRTDYGMIGATGGLNLVRGRLTALDLNLKPADLDGQMAQGHLSAGYVRIRAEKDAEAGEALRIEARLSAEDLVLKTADVEGDPDTHMQGVHTDLNLRVPYRQLSDEAARKSPLSGFDGLVSGSFAVRAAGIQGAAADVAVFEANTAIEGRMDVENTRLTFDGTTRLLSRADSLQTGTIDSRALSFEGQNLALKADLNLNETAVVTLKGPLHGTVGALRQDALFLKDAAVTLPEFSLAQGEQGLEFNFHGQAKAARIAQNDLILDTVTARLDGQGRSNTQGFELALDTDINSADGRYQGLGALADDRVKALAEGRRAAELSNTRLPPGTPPVPAAPEGPDIMVAMVRAVDRFSLRAEGVRVTLVNNDFDVKLTKTAIIRPKSGGEIRVAPISVLGGNQVLISSRGRGGLILTMAGGDLPALTARVTDMGIGSEGAVSGKLNVETAFNFAPAYGVKLKADGRFITTPTGLDVRLDQCTDVTADRADIGGRMTHVTTRLCPVAAPLFSMSGSQWRAQGQFDSLIADAPDFQVKLNGGKGRFDAFTFSDTQGVGFKVALDNLAAADALEIPRFHPVVVTGDVAQGRKTLDGTLKVYAADPAVRKRAPDPVADVVLTSDLATGTGRLDITTPTLTFNPDKLQPLDLTPLVAGVMARDTTGHIDFTGFVGWSKDGSVSGGTVLLQNLTFTSPAGLAEGLNGRIVFDNLSPLNSAPGQTITVNKVTSFVPITDVTAVMQFAGETLKLERADVTSPGGVFALEPMDVPFDIAKGLKGALYFEKVDFGKVVEASAFGKDVDFVGRVSGRVPFEFKDNKITVAKGFLKGDGPGRVSIKRAGLQDVTPDGKVTQTVEGAGGAKTTTAAPSNTLENFAYQAMEHLAYSNLDAYIGTNDKGILGFNFHIQGKYDPPERKEAKIPLFEFLRGRIAQQPIDLPSDTPVNLNLDVNYNLGQILSDVIAVQKRGGFDWSPKK
ncbi:YdbH domain-containing protein [Asticcacaulis sp. BYS171W]|uniref:YdbH domain-containing protein n=1 Tax=Asticcacaulis aquaticus TaxID=2984212 RepID=A0ABT5HXT8_9CAUL|nr:YdbH domain-containing protein [Asticcacaulis aquaticus]MDC7684757.1 YdbH domain-containing protein [Asticcacaulis aquaticus]